MIVEMEFCGEGDESGEEKKKKKLENWEKKIKDYKKKIKKFQRLTENNGNKIKYN